MVAVQSGRSSVGSPIAVTTRTSIPGCARWKPGRRGISQRIAKVGPTAMVPAGPTLQARNRRFQFAESIREPRPENPSGLAQLQRIGAAREQGMAEPELD